MSVTVGENVPVKSRPSGFTPLSRRRLITDRAVRVLVAGAVLAALVPLVWLAITLVGKVPDPSPTRNGGRSRRSGAARATPSSAR